MIALILISMALLMLSIASLGRNAELRMERNAAYDYILDQWRKGLLSQPMDNKLAEKLCEYDGEGKV